MKRIPGLLATLLLLTTAVFAQQPQPAPEGNIVIKQQVIQRQDGAPPLPDGNVMFVASETFSGKVVKGAPYSADSVTETIQTLSDGNRIVNKYTSTVFRDSEGRIRREQTLKALGILGASEEPLQSIFINDPVAGVTYSLDSRSRTAHKISPFRFEFTSKIPPGGAEGQKFEYKVAPRTSSTGSVIMTAPPGVPPQPGARVPLHDIEELRAIPHGATATYIFRSSPRPNPNEVKEQLGKQMIEGVEAEGTRTTITIPAGEIGNERAIEIVTERWYSPELQLVVLDRKSDPRFGETTYKLTNINRAEPAKSLFEVPAGYTVKEGPQFGPANLPLRQRKLANPE